MRNDANLDPALVAALELLHRWVTTAEAAAASAPPYTDPFTDRKIQRHFWPQEQTLQDWTAGALVDAGYACHGPTSIVAEVGLGEEEFCDNDQLHNVIRKMQKSRKMQNIDNRTCCFLYDLVVLNGPPEGAVRSFRSIVPPGARLIVQIKSLISAGKMKPSHLKRDLQTLAVAREFERRQGREVRTLLLFVATGQKDVFEDDQVGKTIRGFVELFGSDFCSGQSLDVPDAIPFALLVRKEDSMHPIICDETKGKWAPWQGQ